MKKTITYLSALLMLASCSDKNEYTPGEPDAPDCPCVYFSNDNDKDFIFVPGENSTVTLNMHRLNTSAAVDVPIIGSCDLEGVTFPASAHFDAGSADTQIEIDFSGLPIKQIAHFKVEVPDQYIGHYTAALFNYESTALVSQWEPANPDGSPVKFYFTDTDYNNYTYKPKVNECAFQPIECEMHVLPGAGLIRITDFMHSGATITFSLTPSLFSDFAGRYRVSPLNNNYSMAEAYESDAYGDEWYNAWYILAEDDEGELDYADCSLTDLDGNAVTMDYPSVYWYSNSYAFEYSYAHIKSDSRPFNSVSMGIGGVPSGDVTLPSYFYLYFQWDGESGL